MKKRLITVSLLIISIVFLITAAATKTGASFAVPEIARDPLFSHDFDDINFKELSGNIISYTEYRNNYLNTTNDYVISFNTADELYNFSVDVSFSSSELLQSEKVHLMNKNYTLGNDIDYSLMKSKRFIPIGYSFSLLSDPNISYELKFNGVFDGRGFEISNLYFAGYYDLIYVDTLAEVEFDLHLSEYHAMFNYNLGTIKNVGLINPTIDVDYEHPNINNFANLVGENNGLVENVYLIETRDEFYGGMRVIATTSHSGQIGKSAAGLVHTNNGTFSNAYYAGNAVVNANYVFPFSVDALVFANTGTVTNLVYDNDEYLEEINLGVVSKTVGTPTFGIGVNTNTLKNGTSELLSNWYYYPLDRYPALFGLELVNNNYLINDATDMITFNKLQNMNSVNNNLAYRLSNYLVTADLNFNDIGLGTYEPSLNEFGGTFDGNNFQISNLTLNKGVLIGTGYYAALFGVVSGTIKNIILSNNKIMPTNYANYFGQHFYVANLVGKLDGGLIHNVHVQGEINLGNDRIGVFSVGGIVGEASGQVIKASHTGSISLGNHSYDQMQAISNNLNVGGIVGSSGVSKLILYNVKNKANINTLTANNLSSSNNSVNLNVGGVIGFSNNELNANNNFGLLTNEGLISVNEITNSPNVLINLGGVIGYSSGFGFENNEFQGLFENKGNFIFNNTQTPVKAAGILVSNHNQTITYNQLFNHNAISVNSPNITATTLVYNMGSNLNINHASSRGSYLFNVNNKDLSAAIINEQNAIINLRYVEMLTTIEINSSNNIETSYAGITLSNNTNYYNVLFDTTIDVRSNDTTSNAPTWIAGIAKELSSGYIMTDTIASGSINIVANKSSNIYMAGLVNQNLSGNLHMQTNNLRPKANLGIINSINQANLTSTIAGDMPYGISGTANVFAGGITTFNSGSVQDALNIGDILIANTDSYIASRVNIDGSEMAGGQTRLFRSGVILGGIAATVADGKSRIYDTSNNGNITGISEHFARVGGLLGQSLLIELDAGNVNYNLYNRQNNVSHIDYISNSVLSNGINYGRVNAITKMIATYNNRNQSWSQRIYANTGMQDITPSMVGNTLIMNSTYATVERIGVYSAAGGIIGYGLSKMYRMINHGEIAATDAAGGIVGATYVFAATQTNGELLNIVNINTAINYGDIRAVRNSSSNYNNINKRDLENVLISISNNYYSVDDPFIVPIEVNRNPDIRRHPQNKRGFGGIFGRIQRGGNQVMTSEGGSFDFIVNMNPNIDLIGRLDQNYNFSWSGTAFRFYNAKYYSAKPNDTTQAVFTGFYYDRQYQVANYNLTLTEYEYEYQIIDGIQQYRIREVEKNYVPSSNNNGSLFTIIERNHQIGQRSTLITSFISSYPNTGYTETITRGNWSTWSVDPGGPRIPSQVRINGGSQGNTNTIRNEIYRFYDVLEVPHIKEDLTTVNNQSYNVYSEAFEMRDDETILTTGEPITSYIYYAENSLLSNTFKADRLNGMYVLSTSSGSNFGSVLPRNLNINTFRTLIRNIPLDYNYSKEVQLSYLNDLKVDLVNKYEELYQTNFNEKSALLEENQIFEIKETGTSQLLLQSPLINYETNEIIFDFYLSMANTQTTFDFEIVNATIPINALITRLPYETETVNEFYTLLANNTDYKIATDELKPILTASNLPMTDGVISLGKIRSYPEAAINDENFILKYYTEYEIFINVIITPPIPPEYDAYRTDNNQTWNVANNTINNVNESIELRFRDSIDNALARDYLINEYVTLEYFDGTTYYLVESPYYEISGTNKDLDRYFTTKITFSNKLRPGAYRISYKYYPNDTSKYINVNYNPTLENRIIDLRVKTGSFYNEDAAINADLAFGYNLSLGTTKILDNPLYENINQVAPYLSNKTYTLPFMDFIIVSDFFEIDTLIINETLLASGYKSYQLDFYLTDGTTVSKVIQEANIKPTYFKDGIRINNGTTSITREANQTVIEIDFNLLNDLKPLLNSSNFITNYDSSNNITKTYNNGVLRLVFNQTILPGVYESNIGINFNGRSLSNVASLVITKLEGVNAYLSDIKFSSILQESTYPDIFEADNSGNIIIDSQYQLALYFAGIDYDNANLDGVNNFRVNGEVSHINLESYTPLMKDYLPIGAKIERLIGYDSFNNPIYSSDLAANFTVDPLTGLPPVNEEEDILITYKVTSENGLNEVFYHIRVFDRDYNVTLIFNLLYEDNLGNYIPINNVNNPLYNQLVKISVLNYEVLYQDLLVEIGSTIIDDVNNYPLYDDILKIRSEVHMFNVANSANITYRFGRNISGFYQFKLNFANDNYTYDIYNGANISDIKPSNKLNYFSKNINNSENIEMGYYYYINGSTRFRTRYFNVVIKDDIKGPGWGLSN